MYCIFTYIYHKINRSCRYTYTLFGSYRSLNSGKVLPGSPYEDKTCFPVVFFVASRQICQVDISSADGREFGVGILNRSRWGNGWEGTKSKGTKMLGEEVASADLWSSNLIYMFQSFGDVLFSSKKMERVNS